MRITKEQLEQLKDKIANNRPSKGGNLVTKDPQKVTNPSKYKNVRGVVDGITFASLKEANYYVKLKALKQSGDISWFIRQVPFALPGKIKYVADFLVVYADGKIEVVDIKGFMTTTFKLKAKLMEETYPFKLKII